MLSGSEVITGVHSSKLIWWINSWRHRIIADTHHIWHYTHSDSVRRSRAHTHTETDTVEDTHFSELLDIAEGMEPLLQPSQMRS